MSDDLVAFLKARLDEDEQAARSAAPGPWTYQDIESVGGGRICDPTVAIANVDWDVEQVDPRIRRFRPAAEADGTGEHIARHDPARVLAEVAAKRMIVDCWQTAQINVRVDRDDYSKGYAAAFERVLRDMARVYSRHPDYRDLEWSPWAWTDEEGSRG